MRKIIFSVVWFVFAVVLLYMPLSFSSKSFNPFEWYHFERLFFGMFVWIGILTYYVAPEIKRFTDKYSNIKV